MRFRLVGILLLCFCFVTGCSRKSSIQQSESSSVSDGYWFDETSAFNAVEECKGRILPLKYRILTVNYTGLRKLLLRKNAQPRTVNHDTIILSVPIPDGYFEEYRITQIQVMPPDLADKYPDIKTYSGTGVENPSDNIRLDISPKGISIMILSTRGTIMTDPFCINDSLHVINYYKKDLPPDAKPEFEK